MLINNSFNKIIKAILVALYLTTRRNRMQIMNRRLFLLFLTVWFLYACKGRGDISPILAEAEKLMNPQPDSALTLLEMIEIPPTLPSSDYAFYCLLLTQARDKNFYKHTSDSLIQVAVDYYKTTTEWEHAARSLYLKGCIHYDLNHIEEAARCYMEALEKAKHTEDALLIGLIYEQLGLVYWQLGGWEEPLYNQQQAYTYYQQAGDTSYYPYALRGIGRAYWRKKMYDSALVAYQEGLCFAEMTNHRAAAISLTSEIGSMYVRKQMYDTALVIIRKAISMTKNKNDLYHKYVALGNAFLQKGVYDSAHYYLSKCIDSKNIYVKIEVYKHLSEIAAKKGDYSDAYRFYHQAIAWDDSIADYHKMQKVSNMQHSFRHTSLTEENQLLKFEKSRQRQFYLVTVCIGLVLASWFYFRYQRYKQQKAYELFIREEKIKSNEALIQAYSTELKQTKKKLNDKEKRLTEFSNQADWKLQQDVSLLIEKKNRLAEGLLEQLDLFKRIKLSENARKLSDEDWTYLLRTIDTLYDNFTIRFQKAYPHLTPEIVRFCVLMKIKLTNQELMNVLSLSKDAIYKRKSRLKKDLLLEKDSRTLDDFLTEF